MNIDVAFLPRDVAGRDLSRLAVVVFDVLRATTTITAALAAGVSEIHAFGDIPSAREAMRTFPSNRLLCGEVNCLPPPGFDLGNSPRAFNRAEHAGRPMLLSTTNGTRALLAAAGAGAVLCGALVNARAVADAIIALDRDVLLLCAGTQGGVAMEDLLGAGAVIAELQWADSRPKLLADAAMIANSLFAIYADSLDEQLRLTAGGQNVIAAGLEADIDFCARLNSISVVGRAEGNP
ncbi:MAG TPA: 2-phosphosulfolactate phosphatase, partial [Tepidisphaeraceae bacterium]|nr:2-phosphosulfolactate phosphatase [Tepidisphaeraceae bacterium]